jgi:putative inorganic carbon (HCO3(-)) transporter
MGWVRRWFPGRWLDPAAAPLAGQWLALAALAYASLVPFYYLQPLYLGPGMPPFSLARYVPWAAGAVLAPLAAALALSGGTRRTCVDGRLVAWLWVGLASLWHAPFVRVGAAKWVYFSLTGPLWCWAVVQLLPPSAAVESFARRLALVGAVVAVYTLGCHLAGADPLWGSLQTRHNPNYIGTQYRATAPFGNPISSGTYLLAVAPLLIWAATAAPGWLARAAWGSAGVVSVYAAVMSQSRGAWLALLGQATLAGFVWATRTTVRLDRERRLLLALAMLLAPVLCGRLAVATGTDAWLENQVAQVSDRAVLAMPGSLPRSEAFRLAQYRTTANVLRSHPWLGVGWGNFTRVFDDYRDPSTPSPQEFPARTTENMLLMLAVETGLVGLAAGLSLLVGLLAAAARTYRRGLGQPTRALALACGLSLAGLMINMTVWDALNDPTIRLLFWTVAGLALALERVTPSHEGALPDQVLSPR